MTCTCLTALAMGPALPVDYAVWLAGELRRECAEHGLSPEDEQVAQWVHLTSGVPLDQARAEMAEIAAVIKEATR